MRTPARKCAPGATPKASEEKQSRRKGSSSKTPSSSCKESHTSKHDGSSSSDTTALKERNNIDQLETTESMGKSSVAQVGRSITKKKGKNKMDEYPILNKFCYTAEELHEEYGLSLKRKPSFIDDCKLLFHKVYQGPPSCGDITAKFARCYAFEKCHAAQKDPARHKIAWARFGESVLNMCSSKPGALDKKVENWKRANGAFHGGLLGSNKKRNYTQGASNMCNIEEDKVLQFETVAVDYIFDSDAIVHGVLTSSTQKLNRLSKLRESLQQKKESLLRLEGSNAITKKIKEDILLFEQRLDELHRQVPCDIDEIKDVEADLNVSKCMLHRLEDSAEMKNLALEMEVEQCHILDMNFQLSWFRVSYFLYNVMNKLGHQYHPLCFVATLMKKDICVKVGCNERISEVAKTWAHKGHVQKKYEVKEEYTNNHAAEKHSKVGHIFDEEMEDDDEDKDTTTGVHEGVDDRREEPDHEVLPDQQDVDKEHPNKDQQDINKDQKVEVDDENLLNKDGDKDPIIEDPKVDTGGNKVSKE
ncbi:hypothetical protein L7F22_018318 [Adiantum nelumboides]|nr:hypothetical protein [Adiantum nelumboides]